MSAPEILVIFLSVALAVFLLLGIVLMIFLIVVAHKIKKVADTAERTVHSFESAMAVIKKAAAPAVVTKFVLEQINKFTERHNKNKEDE